MHRRSTYHIPLITFVAIAAWLLFAKLVAAPLLVSAYREESFPILNDVIAGRDVHPLEFYLDDWKRVARNIALVIAGVGVCAFVLLHPEFQRIVDRMWPRRSVHLENFQPMSLHRTWLCNLFIAFVVALSGYSIAKPVEMWPFSPYPMYAGIARGNTVEYIRLYGVTESSDHAEIPLIDVDYIYPFDDGKFNDMIQILLRQKDQGRIVNVLRDTLVRYEDRRLAGEHDGPALSALKLYRVRWNLDSRASNRDRPDEKQLMAEVQN